MTTLEDLDLIYREQAYASTLTQLRERLTEGEAQYLSALLDGEGCITAWICKRKLDKVKRVHTSILGNEFVFETKIGMSHPSIIDLCNKYGGFWFYQHREPPKKPMYYWVWNHTLIKNYLPLLLPYLKVKKEQAEIMLKIMNLCHGHNRTEAEKTLLKKYSKQIKLLNHKRYPCDTTKYEHLRRRPIKQH